MRRSEAANFLTRPCAQKERLTAFLIIYNAISTLVFIGFAGCFELTIKMVRALLR